MSRGGWDVALDAQNDLRAALRSYEGRRYMTGFRDSLTQTGKTFDPDTGETSLTPHSREEATQSLDIACETVERGVPTWVSADVVALVNHAAETFRPEAIFPEDLFAPSGFAYLEMPVYIRDLHEKRMAVRAVSWITWVNAQNEGDQGVAIALWSRYDDEDDYFVDDDREGMRPLGGSALMLAHVTSAIRFGDDRMLKETSHFELIRFVLVLWRLAQQRIAVVADAPVSRPVWRRKSNWRQIKLVQVLTLRRTTSRRYDGDEREVEWTHRWLVRGHWRTQPYKQPDGSVIYHQIWIEPFVKGPEDKPFVPKQGAVEFVR